MGGPLSVIDMLSKSLAYYGCSFLSVKQTLHYLPLFAFIEEILPTIYTAVHM